ncbi:MAG: hypothetical protein R2762_26725 [Bryobacteraceae bacterium]
MATVPNPITCWPHKTRLVGENPCNVDKIFRKIKIHGARTTVAGAASTRLRTRCGILAGKAYGVPIFQMLGGKFRDKIRMYREQLALERHIKEIAADYKARVAEGFTMLKMDLNVPRLLQGKRGTVFAPAGYEGEPGEDPENYYQGLEISDKGCELVADYVADQGGHGRRRRHSHGSRPFRTPHHKSCIKLANALERVTPSYLEDMVPWFRVEE